MRLAGWIDNKAPGLHQADDINETDTTGGRISLLWTPSEKLSLRATYLHQEAESGGTAADMVVGTSIDAIHEVRGIGDGFNAQGKYETWSWSKPKFEDETDGLNIEVNYDFGNMLLTSSTSGLDRFVYSDYDATPDVSYTLGAAPAIFGPTAIATGVYHSNDVSSLTQEIRLTSQAEGPLEWLVGAFYEDSENTLFQQLPITDDASLNANMLDAANWLFTEQIAIFGELSYDFTDKLKATVGLRWFELDSEFGYDLSGPLFGPLLVVGNSPSTVESDINPKFLLSYKMNDDVLLSAQASKGFRPGGPQDAVPTSGPLSCVAELEDFPDGVYDPDGYNSESLWNFELGLKSSFMNKRGQFNASVFNIIYDDIQVTTTLNGCGFSITSNANKATSQGIEADFKFQLTESLLLGASGSYTDAVLKDDLLSGQAKSGDSLLFSPKEKFNLFLTYDQPLFADLDMSVNLSWSYTGEVEAFWKNAPLSGLLDDNKLDAYSVLNLRVGIQSENWSAAFFVNNALDDYGQTYFSGKNRGASGYATAMTVKPQTVGLSFSYSFGN